jgi:3-phenylpropionate/trans-cinnamate dioxygenase ferredoxin reductase subunit
LADSIVIVGAGHAAGQVVATLKQRQFGGRIVLIGDEPFLPYQRPPLSKKYLAGAMPAERLYFKPPAFYEADNIDVRLGTRVDVLDRDGRCVRTADGETIHYDKLILALGSRVQTVPVAGAELAGIHYLRSIADVDGIRADLAPGRSIVIVGAGYIGLEVAAVCRQIGLDVTVIELADRVLSRVVSPQVSAYFEGLHRRHGVELRLGTGLASFAGDNRVTGVTTSAGHTIGADLVVVGVGIVPNIEIAAAAGLAVDNGIVVDERCRTGDPDIYAVGDCTSHPNGIYGRRLRLESVHNALEQAKTAASNACGGDATYEQVPWFWSDQYEIKLQIAGLSEGYDDVVLRGDPAADAFACFYLRERRLIAVDAVNSPREFMQAKDLIANHTEPDPGKLADPGIQVKALR